MRNQILLATALLLGACASPSLTEDEAVIAPKTVVVVAPPEASGGSTNIVQAIVAHFRDHTLTFDTQIQIAPGTFDLVALDGFGRRALSVHWQAGKMTSEAAPWLPSIVRPADILAAIAIVYGPETSIAQSVRNAGATLTESGTTRTISRGNRELVVVEYGSGQGWSRAAKLRNLAFGYEIDIQSTELAP